MQYLALVVASLALVGCGGRAKERRVCEHGAKLCGDTGGDAECVSKLGDLRDSLGDAYGKSLDCAIDATSCPEFAGCLVGGISSALEGWMGKFERGVDKAMRHGAPERSSGPADCSTFQGSARSATWDGCSDHVRRELRCASILDELHCDCLEDGAVRWSFAARDPVLDNRDDATRLAIANCRMSFGN